jgi:hypothetical protein
MSGMFTCLRGSLSAIDVVSRGEALPGNSNMGNH